MQELQTTPDMSTAMQELMEYAKSAFTRMDENAVAIREVSEYTQYLLDCLEQRKRDKSA